MNASLLVLGNIPKGTECPFRAKCGFAQDDTCNHRGKDHPCDYSCAAARAFDISHQYQDKR
jgi:hypothetical protein